MNPGNAIVRRGVDWRLLLIGVVVLSALYVGWHLDRGWVAHDEGTLGQSAERLLQGELPHRDFDELYTGGLTYLNAAAFRLLGTTLLSMRLVLFVVFVLWIPAVFYVALRLVTPVAAAGVTLLCVVWSLPNYPAPLPSWYNLFLTVFGIAALFRWLETHHRRWLVIAGIAGGLSVLVKVIGLYFVAAAVLFLVFQAHEYSRTHSRAYSVESERRGTAYAVFATACLLAFTAALALLVRPQLHAAEVVQFVLPGAAVAWLLVRNEWTQPSGESLARFMSLTRVLIPFLLGFALPVAIFLIPYARADALGALGNGVFLLPQKRFGVAAYRMLSVWSMLALLPVWALLMYGRRVSGRMSRRSVIILAALLVGYLVATSTVALGYRLVWYAVRGALPVLVLLGIASLARERASDNEAVIARSRMMLLVSVTAVFTLVQFPFSVPIYFCYVAPLGALLAAALYRHALPMARPVPASLVVFLIAFAVLRVNTSMLFGMGVLYRPYAPTASLGLPRGGIDVPVEEAESYRNVVRVLKQHARGGYTWAASDCPEIYFLTGLRNPTRDLFDFFDGGDGRTARILEALERRKVTAIALNGTPQFSPWFSPELINELERRYPHGANLGKFQVRWQ